MLTRKLLRTAWQYKAQFLSMIIMVAIGMGVFIGFHIEWYSLEKDTSSFMRQTAFADYRLMNEGGFSSADIEAIRNIEGVTAASRVLNVNADVKNENKSVALFALESYEISTAKIMRGKEYDENTDGFWLSDKYAAANGIAVGDTLTLTYRNTEVSGEVVGLVKSSEFMVCVADANQLMPDFRSFGFAYVSPRFLTARLGFVYYPQINISSQKGKTYIENEASKALGKTTLVLSKDENFSYVEAKSEIEEGQIMGSLLPVLFLLIGVLTMITTMHRITANEKTQIGTLKALGFSDGKILRHYTSYGLCIGIVGSLLGVLLGYGIGALIISPTRMQGTFFDLPSWKLYMPWYCVLVVAGTVAFLTWIGLLSVRKMLKGTAAETLRPAAPKKIKPLALEKTKLWNKLPFSVKWNVRDVFRYKTRSLMSLVGVIGCMLLLVGGLGMHDTLTAFVDNIDKNVCNYETRVNLAETADRAQAEAFAAKYDGDWLSSQNVRFRDDTVTLEIYKVEHDTVRFTNKRNKIVTLGDDGVYVCLRIAEKGIKAGQTIDISPYGTDTTFSMRVAGILRSVVTENIVMTEAYADSIGLPYRIGAVFTTVAADDIESTDFVSGIQTQKSIMDSYNSFLDIMNTMVLIFVVAAIVLGVVVLYNLGVMGYVERYRELATLKVVGFRDRRIGGILIGQNVILTVVGILLGLPAGMGVLLLLIKTLAAEYELKMTLGALTYCVSILLTFTVLLAVGLLIAHKNKKIDMVEALKGTE